MESSEPLIAPEEQIAELTSPDWQVRKDGVQLAIQLLQKSPTPELVAKFAGEFSRLAGDEKWEVRNAVALAAQYLRHEEFDRIIAKLLEDTHFDVRRSAQSTLRKRRQATALGPWSEEISLSTKEHEQYLRKNFPAGVVNRALKISEKRMDLFIKTSVHELRRVITPLNSRITKAKRLIPSKAPRKLREDLDKAEERCEFLARLLEKMQLWTQEFKPVFAKESLRSMVEEASNLVREGFEGRSPRLRVKTTIQIDPEIRLDAPRARLIQAFLNIIHNSYEAIKKQGLINIAATAQNDVVIIRFEDNGIGMSAETRAVAMRPFTSTKNSTGFGLAITYKIVHEECRGDVEILPTEKGTVIEVTLPRQQRAD